MKRSPENGNASRFVTILLITLIAVIASFHIRTVQFYCDDAYISFRFSENLAEGRGVVYNEGERVEGYTNFLWVMLIAAGVLAGPSAESVALALGLIFLVLALWGTTRLAAKLLPGPGPWRLVPALILASLGPFVLWSVCGLETILFAAALLAAVLAYHSAPGSSKALVSAGALYAVAALARPEGGLFGAIAGIHLIASSVRARITLAAIATRAAVLAGGFCALFIPFLVFRISYYGDWLPNTWYAKSGAPGRLSLGADYLGAFTIEYWPITAAALAGIFLSVLSKRRSARSSVATHLVLLLGVYHLYMWQTGGDYMALYRFHGPILPYMAVFASVALHTSARAIRRRLPKLRPAGPVTASVLTAIILLLSFAPSMWSSTNLESGTVITTIARMRTNSERWIIAGRALGAAWPGATIATTAAGAIPYGSKLSTIDQSGLCDRHTAKVEWEPWAVHKPGHAKTATRAYILSRRPDLILGHPRIAPATAPIPRGAPGWRGYVRRTLPLDGLAGPGGAPLHLWVWVRADRATEAESRGFLTTRAG